MTTSDTVTGAARTSEPAEPGGSPSPRGLHRARRVMMSVVDRLTVGDEVRDRPPVSDVLLAAGMGTIAAVVYATDPVGPLAFPIASAWLGWPLLAAQFVPLVWRRVTPALTMAVTGIATGAYTVLGFQPGLAWVAVLVALYSVAAYGSRNDGRVSLGLTLVFIAVGMVTASARGAELGALEIAVNLFVFVGVWALGDRTRTRREVVIQLRARAEEAERSRGLVAGLAVADERTRIARELHDVVAHAVSVVVVQAGAGRRIAARSPERAAEALASIEVTGREALEELRRLVGVLRDEQAGTGELAPQPTLEDVPALVSRLAATGVPVHLVQEGRTRPLPGGVELSAFRIVQEALTNVLKHAGGVTRVEVCISYGTDLLVVRVRDDGRGAAAVDVGGGAGLVGMRERTALFGGRLAAGPRPGGGFEVRAELPLRPPSPDPIPARAAARAGASPAAGRLDPAEPV